MANEKLNVKFRAKISTADNCVCSACHNVGKVFKLELPETLYRNGVLKTEYSNYWVCLNCRKMLMQALMWGDDDGG